MTKIITIVLLIAYIVLMIAYVVAIYRWIEEDEEKQK